jgi:hypothetical protein
MPEAMAFTAKGGGARPPGFPLVLALDRGAAGGINVFDVIDNLSSESRPKRRLNTYGACVEELNSKLNTNYCHPDAKHQTCKRIDRF